MPGLDANILRQIARGLPQARGDGGMDFLPLRGLRYGELSMMSMVRKAHALADEGSFFVANNAGTGAATAAAPTAFSDTAPMLSITNADSAGNPNAKRVYVDTVRLMETAAGTGGVSMRFQVKIDSADRFSSGGTLLTSLLSLIHI